MKRYAIVLFLMLSVVSVLDAETGPPQEDPIASRVFPPELIMKHDDAVGLTDRQRDAIKAEMQQSQGKFIGYQWPMQKHVARLTSLLEANPVDEGKALAAADQVMQLEMEVKRTHLRMLLRIKNLLTPEQQARLAELREASGK